MIVNSIISVVRSLFFYIDSVVYNWCGNIYAIALKIYDINSFMDTSSIINRTMSVIYSFLAIVMFFRLAISLIEMLIDPSLIDDKQKGAGKMALNVVLTLVLIVAVPMMFKASREIQTKIIDEQVIEKAIYGETVTGDALYTVGDRLALSTWSIFLHPNPSVGTTASTNPTYSVWSSYFDASSSTRSSSIEIAEKDDNELASALNDKKSSKYTLTYAIVLSTICGLYLLWVMIELVMDVAYRALKMLVLEVVSPVAIISFLDPKSSKDGIFAKWLKETVSTYISLFVRIGVYSLVSVILIELGKNTEFNNTSGVTGVKIVYLLAIIALIKNGPKLIDKLFGSELSKDSDTKMAKDLVKGAIGGVTGAAIGGISGASVAKATGNSVLRGGFEGIKKGFSSGYASGTSGKVNAKNLRGVVMPGGGKAAADYFGVKTGTEQKKIEAQQKAVAAVSDHYDALKSAAGFKDAASPKNDATTRALAAMTLSDFAHSKLTTEQAKSIEEWGNLSDVSSIQQQDSSLMQERGKVLDAISANESLVSEGVYTQDFADILNNQSVLKYNKLQASKELTVAQQEFSTAEAIYTQLQFQDMPTLTRQAETELSVEFKQLTGNTNRNSEQEARFNTLSKYFTYDVNTNTVSSTSEVASATKDDLIELISRKTEKQYKLRDADSAAIKADKAVGKVDDRVKEIETSGVNSTDSAGIDASRKAVEYYKALKKGDKVTGR